MLKKAASLRQGYGRPARAFLACRSGFAQAGRHFAVLTYYEYAPRVKRAAVLPVEWRVLARLGWAGQTTDFFEHSLPLTMRGSSELLFATGVKYSTDRDD